MKNPSFSYKLLCLAFMAAMVSACNTNQPKPEPQPSNPTVTGDARTDSTNVLVLSLTKKEVDKILTLNSLDKIVFEFKSPVAEGFISKMYLSAYGSKKNGNHHLFPNAAIDLHVIDNLRIKNDTLRLSDLEWVDTSAMLRNLIHPPHPPLDYDSLVFIPFRQTAGRDIHQLQYTIYMIKGALTINKTGSMYRPTAIVGNPTILNPSPPATAE